MKTIDNDMELNALACSMKEVLGFENVSADFLDAKELKVTWERSSAWICFHISDYLKGAPADILSQLFTYLVDKIFGRVEGRFNYPKEFLNYIMSEEFRNKNIKKYLKRNKAYVVDSMTAKLRSIVDTDLICVRAPQKIVSPIFRAISVSDDWTEDDFLMAYSEYKQALLQMTGGQ